MQTRFWRFLGMLAVSSLPALSSTVYQQNNLVSDIPGVAAITDPNLVNPWGLSSSPASPWWVSDNGAGLATLYNGNTGAIVPLVVTIPPPAGSSSTSAPDGQVFNPTTDFQVAGVKSNFIFATEDGTISAWSGGGSAVLEVDNSASGAVYKGLALGASAAGNVLYAANFNSGKIDVFDSSFAPITLAGSFSDTNVPDGYAPFNIENIGGQLYVTYAQQDAEKHDDVAGLGNGFVDVYDLNGNMLKRLVSNGPLDSPWGLALAPSDFGTFSNDLLVGNFGDGTINVFNPTTGAEVGQIQDLHGIAITNPGLWGLAFGNGASAGATNELFFTAGIPGGGAVEDHGLFGDIAAVVAVPEPAAVWLTAIGFAGLIGLRRRRSAAGRS